MNHQIKRILLDIEQRSFFTTHRDLPVTLLRRDRLRYHFQVEKACIIIQHKFRERYGRILRTRMRETARLVQERERLRHLRESGSLWWGNKLNSHTPPLDYGKCFAYDQLLTGVHGRGHYIQAWQSSEIQAPTPLSFQHMKPNNIMLQTRGLHFARCLSADETRRLTFKKFSSDSLTAHASKEIGEAPPALVCISGTRTLPALSNIMSLTTSPSSFYE